MALAFLYFTSAVQNPTASIYDHKVDNADYLPELNDLDASRSAGTGSARARWSVTTALRRVSFSNVARQSENAANIRDTQPHND